MVSETQDVRTFASRAIEALNNIIECIELQGESPVSINSIVECLVMYSKRDYSDLCECDTCCENYSFLYRQHMFKK